ncbi:MAG: Gfo/Idh/MocA family oxidoreductase [bacterium]
MGGRLKIGIIGTGAIAQVTHIPIWKKIPEVEVVAVCDINKNKAQWIADKFNIQHVLDDEATLTVEVSWALLSEKDFFYTNLFGTKGGALLNPLRIHKEIHGNLVNVTPSKEESPSNLYKKSYENELQHFVNCLKNGDEIASSGEENLERMRIVDAVYESAKTGREVKL